MVVYFILVIFKNKKFSKCPSASKYFDSHTHHLENKIENERKQQNLKTKQVSQYAMASKL